MEFSKILYAHTFPFFFSHILQVETPIHFPDGPYFGTYDNYTEYYKRLNDDHSPHSGVAARATLGGLLLREALIRSPHGGLDKEETFNMLIREAWDTFIGRLAWSTDHSQNWEGILVQFLSPKNETEPVPLGEDFSGKVGVTERIISPPLATTHDLIFPAPGWNEREFKQEFGTEMEVVLVVIVIVMILANIGWAVFTFKNWKHTVIRAASPSFLVLLLFGSILLYLSVLTFLPNLINGSLCKLRPWFLGIGFVVVFGACFAKSW